MGGHPAALVKGRRVDLLHMVRLAPVPVMRRKASHVVQDIDHHGGSHGLIGLDPGIPLIFPGEILSDAP